MSWAGVVCHARFAYHPLNLRIIDEIRKTVTEKCERKNLSRLFQAKNDKDVIATWKYNLGRVLLIFTVRSAGSVLLSLTSLFQAELAIVQVEQTLEDHVAILDIQHKVTVLADKKGADNQLPSVSATFLPSTDIRMLIVP